MYRKAQERILTNLGSVPGIARLPAVLIMLDAVLLYAAMVFNNTNGTLKYFSLFPEADS